MTSVSSYKARVVDRELDELLPHLPAILLDGPKGVGKTATALERARTVRRLDEPKARAIVEADPDIITSGALPILVDEWQRVPSVWDSVKRAVDRDPRGGQFLLTGSSPPAGVAMHSGAGRITTLRMWPMTLPERGVSTSSVSMKQLLGSGRYEVAGRCALDLAAYTDEILASGFPGLRSTNGRAHRAALDGYIDHVLTRDVPEAGHQVRRPATLRAWLRAYAAAVSTTTTWETIRDAATAGESDKPAKSTTRPYLDVLSGLRIIDEVPAWEPGNNHLTKLVRGAKHQLADPALAARLVGVGREQLLSGEGGDLTLVRDGTFLGALFESLATLSVRVFAQAAEARVFHLRDYNGLHEIDLIVERADGRIFAFEAKLSAVPDPRSLRHLRWLRERLGDRLLGGAVLTTGPEAYRDPSGFLVIPLGLLGP